MTKYYVRIIDFYDARKEVTVEARDPQHAAQKAMVVIQKGDDPLSAWDDGDTLIAAVSRDSDFVADSVDFVKLEVSMVPEYYTEEMDMEYDFEYEGEARKLLECHQ